MNQPLSDSNDRLSFSRLSFGMVLPHRSPDPLNMDEVGAVAQRAEALGFRDLWVTENTLDHVYSLDPMVALTYAAALTKTIGLGVSVVTLPMHSPVHVAHQIASLDVVSRGRAILGVGLGRDQEYKDFQIPMARRVGRFRESVALIKAIWSEPKINFHGDFYQLEDAQMALKPVQRPHPPLWLGGQHPDAITRAVELGDGWMGSGAQTLTNFKLNLAQLRIALDKVGRDPASFSISKRVFLAVDEKPGVARERLNHWFTAINGKPALTDTAGIHGTPAQVREQIEVLASCGVNHILLNAVSHYGEQVDALAEAVGLG
ncbi:MAG: LLM class flavin-dependent oxidoreductase [Burkholderiales bacterium]